MPSLMNSGSQMTSTSSGCAPVCCPDCGGLECLCRPRFFSGQLLTDEDLTRLENYITAKNKLHNRYLVGWGVVCGMEVVCNACDGMVTVKSGYALSPCGDDIVVCADAPVDVCSMIQKCARKQPRDCQPAQPGGPDPCSDTTENWILKIHYDEKSSRGIVPLKNTGSAACCTPCACGGSSSCGCGGKSSASSITNGSGSGNGSSCGCGGGSSTAAGSSSQAQCQPTVICETYYFEVCKIQPGTQTQKTLGAMGDRFVSCLTALQGLVSAPPTSGSQQDLMNWCCAIRDNLLDFFADHPGYACSIPARLAVMCQSGADPQTVISQVSFLLAQYVKDCFCGALLPPCPCPVQDAGVPLATITVSKSSGVCRIVSICNLDVRKFATTFPNLTYWLSILPTVRDLRGALANACCKPLTKRQIQFGEKTNVPSFQARSAKAPPGAPKAAAAAPGAFNAAATNPVFQQSHDLSEIAGLAFLRGDQTVDVQTLAYAVLGLTDANNDPFLQPVEESNPMETLAMNQLARPFVEAMLPARLTSIFGFKQAPGPQPADPNAAPAKQEQSDLNARVADLKSQLDAMKQDLKRSQGEIEKLSKRKR